MFSGMRKPNSAKLGTVCMMLAKPRIGLLSAGWRVSKIPKGTPISTAMPVDMTTRNKCSKTSSANSLPVVREEFQQRHAGLPIVWPS